jgi:hypothetical protein
MPRPEELPREIRQLACRNAIELRHRSFHTDVQRLIKVLQRAFKEVEAARQMQTAKARRQKRQSVNLIPTDPALRGLRDFGVAFPSHRAFSNLTKLHEVSN